MNNSERANEILDTLRNGDGIAPDMTVWVSVASLAKLLADGEHLRHQVTELQRLVEGARRVVAERDEARSALADMVRRHATAEAERNQMHKERDEMRAVRDEALKAVASVTASRDALASSSVPVELATTC